MAGPIDRVTTSGTFNLDGGSFDVDSNVWVIGNDDEVLVIDAAHDDEAIAKAVGGRRVVAVVCTHAHDDHVNRAPARADGVRRADPAQPGRDGPVGQTWPDRKLHDGDVLSAGGDVLRVLQTPGHSPGSSCLYGPELGVVVTGDTQVRTGQGDSTKISDETPRLEERIAKDE